MVRMQKKLKASAFPSTDTVISERAHFTRNNKQNFSTRIMVLTPIGLGQRGLIVAHQKLVNYH